MWSRKKMCFCFLLIPFIFSINIDLNNTCRSYSGYLNQFFSADCYYAPDLHDDVDTIIQRHVGACETHEVETDDGYVLGLFRIRRRNPKGVILLDHPITHDSRVWVSQFNQSIAFLFWRAGYDVWLCNSRGTFYSRKHKTLTINSPIFWNHSFHEMGFYDSHATINYIRRKSNGSKIIHLGYSMGGTKALVYLTTRLEDAAESIKTSIIIASGSALHKGPTILKNILPHFYTLRDRFDFLDLHSSIARIDAWYMRLGRSIFRKFPFKKITTYFIAAILGWTPDEADPNLSNVIVEKLGLEVSYKTLHHFVQIYNSGGKFQMYDYGEKGNLVLYRQREPSLYPLDKIKVPVIVVYGEKDTLSYSEDNEVLYKKLPKDVRAGKLQVRGFNHNDFIFGKRRNGVYKNIIQILGRL